MVKLICQNCGKEFKTNNKKRKYCCYACNVEARLKTPTKDISGQRFGRLTAVEIHHIKKYTYPSGIKSNIEYWLCKCDCGNNCVVNKGKLMRLHTKSCGCLRKEILSQGTQSTTHGLSKTRIYETWHHMKQRCYYEKSKRYSSYGGRGITICDEWKSDFKAFYDWAMANGYTDELTIDRIDVNGNYEPSNCRWITMKEQQRNTRANHHLTYKGETYCIAEWAERYNLKYETLKSRLYIRKWSVEKALETPVKQRKTML